MNATIRNATEEDVPLLLEFIRKLARYERLEHRVSATEDVLREELFSRKAAEAFFVEVDGKAVGFALYYFTFSTFLGKRGVYLEDLFVDEDRRGSGYGRALLAHLARIARERGCARLDWSVLNWNEPSKRFYRSLGAAPVDDWTVFRLVGTALDALAEEADSLP